MMTVFWFIFVAAAAYIIGSLNYSIIVSNAFTHSDIREKGSGNAGSTNMMRNFGWKAGVVTLCTDFLKTFAVTNGAWSIFVIFDNMEYARTAVAVAGLFCAVGHCFPVFFKFKGGKGVAVGGMTILMVDWRCFMVVVAAFLICVLLTRHVSLGSIMGAAAFPISLFFLLDFTVVANIISFAAATVLAVMVIAMHHKNIVRLIKGTESKISFKK